MSCFPGDLLLFLKLIIDYNDFREAVHFGAIATFTLKKKKKKREMVV